MPTIPSNVDASSGHCAPVVLVPANDSTPDSNTAAVPQTGNVTVAEIRSLDQLASIRKTWLDLVKQTPNADIFLTPFWLETQLKHFGDDTELRFLVISHDGRPSGILPLVIESIGSSLGTLRVLTYPLDWWGTFFGPIGADPNNTLRVGLEWIEQQPRDWDFVELRFVFSDQPERSDDLTIAQMQQAGFGSVVKEPMFHCARINLANTDWEQYLTTRRKSWKTNIRRTENKTKKLGTVEHIRYRPKGTLAGEDDPRWEWYEECYRLSQLSWQGTSDNTQTFAHPKVNAFLRDVHQQAVCAGHVDMNLLLVDGKAVAYHYGYHWDGYFSSLRLGFDPDFSKQGVGTVLTSRMIQDSFNRGDHTFDFLPDCLKAKLPWQTSVDVGYRYTNFPSSFGKAGLLRLKRWFDREVRKQTIVPT